MSENAELIEIYLVPGFLGFARLAELDYFIGVQAVLKRRLKDVGLAAAVHAIGTVPAGSLPIRAEFLAKKVAATHDPAATSVHFVGHSTGGLDVRLLLSPGSEVDVGPRMYDRLGTGFARYAEVMSKVKTAVGVASPQYGTPIATAGVRLSVDAFLQSVARSVRIRGVRRGVGVGLRAGAILTGLVQQLPLPLGFLDWVDAAVLSKDPLAVLDYLDAIGVDVGALGNLTPEASRLANALLLERPGVSYGSIVTGTNQPTGLIRTGDPLIYANTVWFRLAWHLAAARDSRFEYPPRLEELRARYAGDRAAGLDVGDLTLEDRTSDGIVPSVSQAYGTILGVFASDHLDCIGHFPHSLRSGTEVSGWVRSGASFTKERFELLWGRVAAFVAASMGRTLPDVAAGTRLAS